MLSSLIGKEEGDMFKKSFTLVEVLVNVVIIGCLSTLGIASYQSIIYKSHIKTCEMNVKGLTIAVQQYARENSDTIPGTLSMLNREQVMYAYNKVYKEDGLVTRLARDISRSANKNNAYAISFNAANFEAYGAGVDMFICPTNPGTQLYQLNPNIINQPFSGFNLTQIVIEERKAGVARACNVGRPEFACVHKSGILDTNPHAMLGSKGGSIYHFYDDGTTDVPRSSSGPPMGERFRRTIPIR